MSPSVSQITSLAIVYSIVFSGTYQRKHQSSASLAFVRGIHRRPVNSSHKWPVTRKMFPFDDVIMNFSSNLISSIYLLSSEFRECLQCKSLGIMMVWFLSSVKRRFLSSVKRRFLPSVKRPFLFSVKRHFLSSVERRFLPSVKYRFLSSVERRFLSSKERRFLSSIERRLLLVQCRTSIPVQCRTSIPVDSCPV